MPKKIPTEVIENAIREKCKFHGYSFVKWCDERKSKKSKIELRCGVHENFVWSTIVETFVDKVSRCPKCTGRYRYTLEEREHQILEKCTSSGYEFKGWVDGYSHAKSKIIIKCPHHGEFMPALWDFVNTSRGCPWCAGNKNESLSDIEHQIKDKCIQNGSVFLKWESSYQNRDSKLYIQCNNHGAYITDVRQFLTTVNNCPECYRSRRVIPESVRMSQINKICSDRNYRFLKWVSQYEHQHSKMLLICSENHEWSVSVDSFVVAKTGCPNCALKGYDNYKTGYLYALRSECGKYLKIGITNHLEKRMTQLRRATPFDFHVIECYTNEDGSVAPELERLFHDLYQSAGLKGFDGATEWLMYDPNISLSFKLISGG